NRVVDDFNLLWWNLEQALGVLLGKIGDREDTRCVVQYPLGESKMEVTLHTGMAVDAVHVVEQVVHRDHIGTRNALRLPEKMRDVQQVAAKPLQQLMQFEVTGNRKVIRLRGQRLEICR